MPLQKPVVLKWQRIMWIATAISLAFTILALLLVVVGTIWHACTVVNSMLSDKIFAFSTIGLIHTTLLRLLAELAGTAIAFSGLAISFYAYSESIKLTGNMPLSDGGNSKWTLITSSPGVFSLIIGAIIIACSLFSKGEYSYTDSVSENRSQETSSNHSESGLKQLPTVSDVMSNKP